MTTLFIVIALVLGVSFLCSLLEAVILSVQSAFIAVKIEKGHKSGLLLQHHKKNLDRAIAAILTLNTFANSFGSIIIGAKVHELFGDPMVTAFSVVFTMTILVFSEIMPKTLGASRWQHLASFAAYAIQIIIFLLYPIIWAIEFISRAFGGVMPHKVSREEMIKTAEIGVSEGTLHKKESTVIKNLLMLDNMFVSDIMTPRSVLFALDEESTVEEVGKKYKPLRFSRIPVYHDSLDNIVGMTHRYKILEALSHDHDNMKIAELTTPITSVSEKMSVAALIDFFIKHKEHIALVRDEYGVVTGLVSLEDAVETLLGVEIVDEFDSVVDLRQHALEQWQQRKSQIRKPLS